MRPLRSQYRQHADICGPVRLAPRTSPASAWQSYAVPAEPPHPYPDSAKLQKGNNVEPHREEKVRSLSAVRRLPPRVDAPRNESLPNESEPKPAWAADVPPR